ncbi:MAG: DUF4123 domain-containing protein [Paracoccaceae bacterium]
MSRYSQNRQGFFVGDAPRRLPLVLHQTAWDKLLKILCNCPLNQASFPVRSERDLNQVWQHLRKFTRLRDDAGKWFYFRFWEPGLFAFICNSMPKPTLFRERFFARDASVNTIVFADNTALIAARSDTLPTQKSAITLDEHLLEVLRDYSAFRNIFTITDQRQPAQA